ncbi:MAG TPA: hypothetical protein VG935_01260 [Patescibacteria group bacterium]|nr:hypothetical protein [Patescibacteria group bacterium]
MDDTNELFSPEDLQKILDSTLLPDEVLYLMLGSSLDEGLLPNILSDEDPMQEGEDFFDAFTVELYNFLCDPERNSPKEWVKEAMEGDIREIAVYILTIALSTFNLGLGIAIPLTALFAKRKIKDFCHVKPPTPTKTVQEFLTGDE